MKRLAWTAGLGGFCALAWVMSCVSNSDTGITPGADGGACLENNTCNTGLVCTLQGGVGVCGPPGMDASFDGPGSTDAGADTDARADAPHDVVTEPCPVETINTLSLCGTPSTQAWTCYSTGDAQVACGSPTLGSCATRIPSGSFTAECFGEQTAYRCCLAGTMVVDGGCGLSIDVSSGNASFIFGPNKCGTGGLLCRNASTCVAFEAGTQCVPAAIVGAPALEDTYVGVCMP